MTDTESKVVSFYANKIHNNPAFYELEKKGSPNIKLKDIRTMMNINKRKRNIVELRCVKFIIGVKHMHKFQ